MTSHSSSPLRVDPASAAPLDVAITLSTIDGAVVCALAGDLHMDNEDQVRHALARALARQPAVLAVDLSAVDLLTSSGLNALLTTRHRAIEKGVELILVAPSAPARSVLRITEVDTVLRTVDTLAQALRGDGQNLCGRQA